MPRSPAYRPGRVNMKGKKEKRLHCGCCICIDFREREKKKQALKEIRDAFRSEPEFLIKHKEK